ncbi:MAG: hypothetical protein IIB81_01565 [Nanoarchaeota archaeon]|nr:hypothetical protein [Nanoarchaeota archaeon]
MMTKKDFKELANFCAAISNDQDRNILIYSMMDFCRRNNSRFEAGRFREWIRRVRAGEDLKGLK